MKIEPNWKKGTRYFWVHKATLACDFIGVRIRDYQPIALHTMRPKDHRKFHRVEISVVRTKREAAAIDAKFEKLRAKTFARMTTLIAKHRK